MTTDQKTSKPLTVGGQAVIEGVMMRSPNRISLAVRNPAGEIVIQGWDFMPYSKRKKILDIPIVRGFVNMVEMLFWGMKTLELSAQIATGEDTKKPSKSSKIGGVLSIFLGLAIGILLFAYSPLFIAGLLGFRENPLFFNLIAGGIRVTVFMLYLLSISLMKDVKRLFQYHGAEHKTINAFEHGDPLMPDRIQKYGTLHPRCGTSFLLIVAFAAILFFSIIDGLLYTIWHFAPKPLLRLPIHLALIPFLAGISYELLKLTDKFSRNNVVGKIIIAPGMWLQKITTKPPDNSMLEVAIAALMDSLKNIQIGRRT